MSKKLLSIRVKGNNKDWGFRFYGDPKYIKEWEADGLEVQRIINTYPEWAANAGLSKPWCFFQDLLNFKNPFRGPNNP